MADFMTSTHRTNWIFTSQDIVSYNCSSIVNLGEYHVFLKKIKFMNGLLYAQKHKYKVANQRAKQALEKVCLLSSLMFFQSTFFTFCVLVDMFSFVEIPFSEQ